MEKIGWFHALGRLLVWLGLAALVDSCCKAEWDPYKLAVPSAEREWSPPPAPVEIDSRCYRTDFVQQAEKLLASTDRDLSIIELVDLSLQASPKTRMTWAASRAAAAEYGISRAEVYPDFYLKGTWMRHRTASFFGGNELLTESFTRYAPDLEVQWLLFNFGATQADIEEAREVLLAANWTHNREVQTVIQTVLVDYYTYIGAQQQYEAGLADLTDAEINLEQTILKHQLGIADLSDEATALAQVAQTRLSLLNYEQEMVDSLGQLVADVGLPANMEIQVEGIPEEIPVREITDSVDQAVCQAYRSRPDLRAAYANIQAKEAAVFASWRDALPSLYFTGQFGRAYFDGGINDKYDFDFGLTLYIPIFQGFETFNQMRKARANLEASLAELRQLEITMVQDVVTEYRDFQIAGEMVYAGEEYVVSAEESYLAALTQYRVGTVDFTTVANALRVLADARAALVEARTDWYVSLTNLAYAVGILSVPASCKWKRHEEYNVFE